MSSSDSDNEFDSDYAYEFKFYGPAVKRVKVQLIGYKNHRIRLCHLCKADIRQQMRKRHVRGKNARILLKKRGQQVKLPLNRNRGPKPHALKNRKAKNARKKKIPKNKRWNKSDFCETEKIIGEGTFGKVFVVNSKQFGQKLVIKALKRLSPKCTTEEAILEARIQKRANHVNIVKCFGTFIHSGCFCLVLEFCPMGDLLQFVKKNLHSSGKTDAVILKTVKSIVRQIVSGVEYAQNKLGYIHMDLKLDNVLLLENLNVKVTDFGCAVQMKSPRHKHFRKEYQGGVPATYSPPELLKRRGFFFDSTTDTWAIGCITYAMLTKTEPFCNDFNNSAQKKACIKNALRVIRNFQHGKTQNKFTDRLGSYKSALTFLRHIFVPRTNRPLVKNLLELDWLN